jgi:nucleotide-binding universal stress UspA family protein
MVHLEWDGEVDARVKIAADLADRFRADLLGINAWMPRPRPLLERDVADRELASLKKAAHGSNEKLRTKLGVGSRKVDVRTFIESPTECIAREMRAADILVMGREFGSKDPYLYPDPAAVVLNAGRPVLMVPPGVTSIATGNIVVAWTDTRESRRAVSDALPFLRAAEQVVVTEICEMEPEVAPSQKRLRDVAQFLSRHGVSGISDRVRPLNGTADVSLFRLVKDSSADLIVAGAYGHSRLGEWIFGGMTKALLENSPVCTLLSH